MSDYRLDRLNTREFEHLIQALCKKFIAVGTTTFGDGPDGGREASFDGKMDYPSQSEPWNGYLVVQCKFRQRSNGAAGSDADWAVKQLSDELSSYPDSKNASIAEPTDRRPPQFYIFVTNAVLSGNAGTGGHDRCAKVFEAHAARLGLKGYAIWGFDEIRAYLDQSPEIRQAYIGFILPGDVLHAALRKLDVKEPDVEKVFSNYLQKELQGDFSAKLESAGQHDEKRAIPLSRVFIDLPFTTKKEMSRTEADANGGVIKALVGFANSVVRHHHDMHKRSLSGMTGRFAIVGGPGQGKSTIGQFLCQVYRAALLEHSDGLDPLCREHVAEILDSTKRQLQIEIQSLRFPFRIILNRFATDLSRNPSLTIFEHVKKRIEKLGGGGEISTATFNQWMSRYPWIFILDGLDEVPSSSNRSQVLEAIKHFLIDMATQKADIFVIATTRPQGYAEEFSASYFQHVYLPPLSQAEALKYGAALMHFRSNGDDDKFEDGLRKLTSAASNSATMRLMASPLQVTIMTTLVERLGEPPKQRYKLFAEYYRTIYSRETSREGPHSELLRDRNTDIDIIHYRTGLLLQAGSEIEGKTDSSLPLPKFLELVRARLEDQGLDTNEIARLTNEIKTSALDRLIFLVSPHDETVGFEIRSLQEFMAAEALARGETVQIRDRLTEIAPINNWINVFLFLVGCLCEKDDDYLLNHTILLCTYFNDPGLYPDYALLKWGSRIALSILADGATRPAPKRERALLRTALELLDHELFDDAHELAAVYHVGLDEIYRQKLERMMVNFDRRLSLPAWKLLDALALRGIQWAKDLFLENWQKVAIAEKRSILQYVTLENSWHLDLVAGLLPQLTPGVALALLSDYELSSDGQSEKDWPRWLVSLLSLRAQSLMFFEDPRVVSGSVLLTHGEEISGLKFEYMPLISVKFDEAIFDIPSPHESWKIFFSLIRFAANPNKETMAQAVRDCARDIEHEALPLYWKVPLVSWPLGVLLNYHLPERPINTVAHLEALANSIDAGEYGDRSDWEAAEAISSESGRSIDLADQKDWPYSARSLKKGMPLTGLGAHTIENTKFVLSALGTYPSGPIEKWLIMCFAGTLFRAFYGMRFEDQTGASEKQEEENNLQLSGEEVLLVLQNINEALHYFDSHMIAGLLSLSDQPAIVAQGLDQLCNGVIMHLGGRDSNSRISTLIREAMLKEKLSERSFKWGLWAINAGIEITFPLTQLSMSHAFEKLNDSERVLFRIGADDFTVSECEEVINTFAKNLNQKFVVNNLGRLPAAIYKLPTEDAKKMIHLAATKLSPELPLSALYRPGMFWEGMNTMLNERRSSLLTKSTTWRDLGLFPIPRESDGALVAK